MSADPPGALAAVIAGQANRAPGGGPKAANAGIVCARLRTVVAFSLVTVPRERACRDPFGDRPSLRRVPGVREGGCSAHLARDGHRCVIVDLDLANPNQSVIFGLREVRSDPCRRLVLPSPGGIDNLGVVSIGPLLKDGEALSWSAATRELFIDLLAGGLDLEGVEVVLVDLPPGDSPVLSKMSRDLDLFIGVTSGHATSLDGIGRFSRIGKQVLVENLSRCEMTVEGRVIEARLFESAEGTLRSAEAAGLDLVTSMPWAESALYLGESDEIGRLCEVVLGART